MATMRRTAMILGLALLLAAVAPSARAGDGDGQGDSPAEQAFRDAYWAETSRGDLDVARAGYAKAAEAEGPDAVRARAYYRLAVVLERMGRTGDAIRALEKLAAAHPDETELQAKARERLAEWTAVDLQKDFAEWYRRYLYSPEFQARIVEYVLALSTESKSGPATAELLTIGAPAIPALEAHLDSANPGMRGRVVDLLLQMGEVPHPRHLLATGSWTRTSDRWERLLTLPPERKAKLRAQVEGDAPFAKALRAALDDSAHWPAALRYLPQPRLLDALLRQPMDDALRDGLLALVGTFEGGNARLNETLARALFAKGLLPDDVTRGWLKDGPRDLQELVLEWIANGALEGGSYMNLLLDLLASRPPDDYFQTKITPALIRALVATPLEAIDWERLTQVYLGALGTYVSLPTPGGGSSAWLRAGPELLRRFLIEVVERAADPSVAGSALNSLANSFRNDPQLGTRLLAWVEDPSLDPSLQELAARVLGDGVTAETLDGMLAALERMPPKHAETLLGRLERHRKFQALPWTDERLLRLMAWLNTQTDHRVIGEGRAFFKKLHEPRYRLENTVRLALASPTHAWREALSDKRHEFEEAARAIVHAELPTAWEGWSSAEREAALRLFRPYFHGSGYEALAVFFQQKLHDPATARPVKRRLVAALPEGTFSLDDIRAAFDLDDPEQALDAGLTLYGSYPDTHEMYEALSAALRAADDDQRFRYVSLWLSAVKPELTRRAAVDLFDDPKVEHRKAALAKLSTVRTAADTDLFAKALADESPLVRKEAAKHLARQWNQKAVRALVRALDDPDPSVRDEVLATLTAIQKIEEQKQFWREAVRADGTLPK